MTRQLVRNTAIMLLLAAAPLASCTSQAQQENIAATQAAQQKGGELSASDFQKKLAETPDAQVVDVRTPKEFQGGYLHNALNVDYNSNQFAGHMQQLDKTKPTFVYCLSGGRSASAAKEMRKAGFTEVYEMNGGMMAWNKANLPVQTGQKSTLPGMSKADYTQKVNAAGKLVLVDFNAPWCAPCRKMAPMLHELEKTEAARLNLLVINTDENKPLAKSQDVTALPTLKLYKNGKEVWRHEGYIGQQDLLAEINKH